MLKNLIWFLFCCCHTVLLAQKSDSLYLKNGIIKPNILAIHHFGLFSSRVDQNFKIAPPQKTQVSFNYSSGNTFHPFVEAYFPKHPEIRKQLSQVTWYNRSFNFIDQETTPADYMNIVIDAVIKEFRANLNIPISEHHEFGISLRSYLITKGKYPFSFFTSDESIEWFHSRLWGGEDPYGRRYYGLNQVNFEYNDRKGNTLKLRNNDFFIGGVELSHYYYPSFLKNPSKQLYFNIGNHLGINTSKFNPSIDYGLSLGGVKRFLLKNKNEFNVGLGSNVLYKNVIDFGEVVDLGNNRFLAAIEANIEFTKYTQKHNFHAFSVNYHIQSRNNKLKEADYYKLLGQWKEINGGWQHGVETLYKALSNWTFIYTYGRPKLKLSLFFKEDFLVNNAPDFQTGVGLQIPFYK
ncbi:hypothetical protein [Aestuariivivens sp. NBU2969]|uniref:hypothetical protein n=1 Tax=Aestuariivivens sp. NBU2969 TaxID=2873267 RepID=UPI001CBAFB52|nr:hypothetical protein [Aestuariivivens sp. NBU2969]